MFMGMGIPIPDLSNLPGASRPGGGGGGGGSLPQVNNVYSMEFDGSNNIIVDDSSGDLETANVSASVWFKGNTQSVNFNYLMSKVDNSGSKGYAIYAGDSNNKLSFFIWNGTSFVVTPLAGVVMDNNWHHAVGTFDGANLKLYVDGSLYSSTTSASGIVYDGGDLIIGAQTTAAARSFEGKLDEAAIWNTALTQEQVESIYNATTTGKTADLSSLSPVAWYRMGD